ncbi:28S ribosomal protein S28, mitochondrial [Diorhabda carinulata]|uniref:28S ribosomal protein S28, mitochondrial n=1 Tax=Diorhabda carinulata TaxID=1163345 RepID=UPI00259FEF67|nr:28S ribosomal protein S28, mitochondrial [Diorhabda carinulata]
MFARNVSKIEWLYKSRPQVLLSSHNKLCSSDATKEDHTKKSGYAQAFTKFENLEGDIKSNTSQTFASLLRNSRLMDMGDPEGKMVIGKIYHIVNDDLYIDFGWKFYCVCPRPKNNASSYIRGAKVRLIIKDLELSSKFLGFEKDLTLLEADCQLIGLQQDRGSSVQNVKN